MKLLTTALTDVGRVRAANEDSYVIDDETGVLAVADGMGGHQAGEVASATAIAALQSGLKEGRPIDEAIVDANTVVIERASSDPELRGMGTTLTAAVVDDDHVLLIGPVGDSRAYVLRDGEFEQLTVDHSVVAELIAAGQLTEAEAEIDPRRAMITRALGIDVDVDVDVIPLDLSVGDRVLFCSDGLTTMVRDEAIADVLRTETDRARAAQELVEAANSAGGADNITVLLVDVVDDDATVELSPPPDEPEPAAAEEPEDADTADLEPEAVLEADPEPALDGLPAGDLDIELGEAPAPPRKRHWWRRRDHS
jgi:protein phosphatase